KEVAEAAALAPFVAEAIFAKTRRAAKRPAAMKNTAKPPITTSSPGTSAKFGGNWKIHSAVAMTVSKNTTKIDSSDAVSTASTMATASINNITGQNKNDRATAILNNGTIINTSANGA